MMRLHQTLLEELDSMAFKLRWSRCDRACCAVLVKQVVKQKLKAPTNLMQNRALTDLEIRTYVHDASMMPLMNNCVCLYSLAVFMWTVAQHDSITGLVLSEYSVQDWDHMR